MKRSHAPLLAAAACLAALSSGCLAPRTAGLQYTEKTAGYSGNFRLDDAAFGIHLLVTDVLTEETPEGFLRVFVHAENADRSDFRCAWRIAWLDRSGFEMRHARAPWRELRLSGRDQADLEAICPILGAKGFRIHIRPQDDETRADEMERILTDALELMKTDEAFLAGYRQRVAASADGRPPLVAVTPFENNVLDGRGDAFAGNIRTVAETVLRKTTLFRVADDADTATLRNRNESMSALGEDSSLVDFAAGKKTAAPDYLLLGELRTPVSGDATRRALHLRILDAKNRETAWQEETEIPVR